MSIAPADEQWMRTAIELARRGIATGQTPFGAVIVRNGELLGQGHNAVWREHDPTAHAEIRAIRDACKRTKAIDLSGSTIYTTTEPCPMCFTAIHWARISRIVYGATIADASDAGFNELTVSNETLKQLAGTAVRIDPGCLRPSCAALFGEWKTRGLSKAY